MNYDTLENERKKICVQVCIAIFVIVLSAIILFLYVTELGKEIGLDFLFKNSALAVFAMLFLIISVLFTSFTPKNFENSIKSKLLPSILENIAGSNGTIYWRGELANIKEQELRQNTDEYSQKLVQALDLQIDTSGVLFKQFCNNDDNFYGIYKDTLFSITEYNHIKGAGKSKYTYIKGIVISILSKEPKYRNNLVIIPKKQIRKYWAKDLLKNLQKVTVDKFFNESMQIYTNNIDGIENVLSQDFIDFVNSKNSQYTYAFMNGNVYLIFNTARDYFKMGSVFKKIDDEKQYEKFERDISEMLSIVEQISILQNKII